MPAPKILRGQIWRGVTHSRIRLEACFDETGRLVFTEDNSLPPVIDLRIVETYASTYSKNPYELVLVEPVFTLGAHEIMAPIQYFEMSSRILGGQLDTTATSTPDAT